MRDRRAARAGAAGQGLPDSALEDPRADRVGSEVPPEADVGAVGEDAGALDLGPDRLQIEGIGVLDADRALRVADRDVLEAERLALRLHFALTVRGTSREVGRRERRAAHIDL